MAMKMFDKFVVQSPQDTFTLSKVYSPGTNSLFVYVNGLLCSAGENYEEVNPITIKFSEPVGLGDIVIVAPVIITNVINIDFDRVKIVGTDSNSIFKRFDADQHLMFNQKYELTFTLNGKTSKFSFTSKYAPMYSTLKAIRMDLLDLIDNVDDDIINYTIWQNSRLADELVATEISSTAVPFYVKQWVRYKTELDLINSMYLAISGKVGKVSKKLGDMEIERSISLPSLASMLSEIKLKLAPFTKLLTGVGITGKSFKKANSYPYPVVDRRSF